MSTKISGYQPLEAADTIRLMVLQPGKRDECIRFSLVHTTLSERSVYDAVSYERGHSEQTVQAYMDGASTRLRANLWLALFHLRSTSHERVLWVDAVCIDQNNIEERNRQIRLMGDIYSKADAVIIWLGMESDTSSTAMDWVRDYSSRFGNLSSLGLRRHVLGRVSTSQIIQQQVNLWKALDDLCSRDYWRRVWIVQEVVLARRLILCCGDTEANWDGFSNLMNNFNALFKPKSCRSILSRIRRSLPAQLHQLREMDRYKDSGCTLVALMEMTSDSLSTDPRDKVYGLLGLASDVHEFRTVIDYSQGLTEMYQSLWHSVVAENSPCAYDHISSFFTRILKNTPFEYSCNPEDSRSHLCVPGRSVGTIVYAGQPWYNKRMLIYGDTEDWVSIMQELRSRGFPVEEQFRVLKCALREAKFVLADPFFKSNETSEGPARSAIVTTPAFGSISDESNIQLEEEIVFRPGIQYEQDLFLIILSGGQLAISISPVCVGDEVYQFQNRDVTVVCDCLTREMKCSLLLPWRCDGEFIQDPFVDDNTVEFYVASGTPTEHPRDVSDYRNIIARPTSTPEHHRLLEVSSRNLPRVGQKQL